MLNLHDTHLLELGKFMYSYKHSLLPIGFRNADAFKLPFCRTNTRQFSVSYMYHGPKYFNSLDKDICNSISLSFFKIGLKNYIVNSY